MLTYKNSFGFNIIQKSYVNFVNLIVNSTVNLFISTGLVLSMQEELQEVQTDIMIVVMIDFLLVVEVGEVVQEEVVPETSK